MSVYLLHDHYELKNYRQVHHHHHIFLVLYIAESVK